MRMKLYLMLVTMCVAVLWTCAPKTYNPIVVRPASCSDDIQFAESPTLGHLLQFADRMHKPVFIDFYTPWIESCNRMDKTVFTHDAVAEYFNKHFINYKVNVGGAPPGPQLADMYGVTTFPTLLFVDGKGKIMLRHEGPATAAQMMEMASFLHESVKEEVLSMGTR